MIDWNNYTNLTKEEWLDFLKSGFPYLVEMENKNRWDFYINDFNFNIFCNDFLCDAYNLNPPKEWQDTFPKVCDLMTLCNLINEIDWSKEEQKYRNDNNDKLTIYHLIFSKIIDFTNQIFSDEEK